MHTPFVILKWLARAVVRRADRLADRSLVEVLPDVAEEVWPRWAGGASEEQLRARVRALAVVPDALLTRHAERLAEHAARGLREDVRRGLTAYLSLVPTAVRNACRRPADPSGTSVPAHLPLRRAEDLLPLLPSRLPRLSAGDSLGGYQVGELLGCTALGETWRAGPGGAVVRTVHDPAAVRQVRRDAEHVRRLAELPAVRVLDVRADRAPAVVVYESVPGGSLAALVREWHHWQPPRSDRPPWLTNRANRLLLDLAAAVGQCHRLDPPLVHGHLKPSNVLLRSERGRLRPLLGDLVVSQTAARHALDKRLTRAPLPGLGGRGCDSWLYASPQQQTGLDLAPPDDVYALGVLWSELLTGAPAPVRPKDLAAWARQLAHQGLPGALLDLLTACLAEDPARRPVDAAELADRLGVALGQEREAVPAAPPAAAVAAKAKQAVLTVCASGRSQFRTIGEALRRATAGARILVRPGTYRESLTLFKNVEIVGEGPAGTVALESETGDCIYSGAAAATVRNLTLRCRAGKTGKKFYCVEVTAGRLLLEDCDLTSDSLACLAVHGTRARPELRRCTLHGSQMGGSFFFDGAGGLLEDCDIFGNRYPGVEITGGANPTVRRCQIHHQTEHNGVMVYGGGRGTFEDCDIHSNRYADVRIHDGGNPTLRRCRIHDGLSCGVFVMTRGQGLLEDCEVLGHANAEVEVTGAGTSPTLRRCRLTAAKMAALFFYEEAGGLVEDCEAMNSTTAVVEFKGGAAPVLRRCKIHGGKNTGVLLWENCRGALEQCQVYGHAGVGVSIKTGGDPLLSRCRVRDGQKGGVAVVEGGKGRLEDCDLIGNALVNLEVRQQGDPVLLRCRVRDGKQGGVVVGDEGKGTLEGCDVRGNAGTGLEITGGGSPLLKRCRIRDGRQGGVLVWEKGKGRLEECEISGNALAAVEIRPGGQVVLRKCRIVRGKQPAVWAHRAGVGTVEQCEVSGESGDAWRLEDGCQVQRHGNKE